ncbi:MAG: SurA N-terminal domain-containing protein [Bacteroidia bacterium]|nr:SurA N-terminal domain-containing protein [Bacteroidia bacterium]MDW8302258.1 SurA N-terminal domain-containing protein [Bacteroidia bacterium]
MGIMNSLRERGSTFILVSIGLAIISFLIMDVYNQNYGIGSRQYAGKIAGKKIPYAEYEMRVNEQIRNMEQRSGKPVDPSTQEYIRDNVWNTLIEERLLGQQYKSIGLAISSKEMTEAVRGPERDPIVIQTFTNQETNSFDEKMLNDYLAQRGKNREADYFWAKMEEYLESSKLRNRLSSLVKAGLNASYEAAKYEALNRARKVNIKFISFPYVFIADSLVKPTRKEMLAYYNENKQNFLQNEEEREIEYVAFMKKPSREDTLAAKKEAEKLAKEFKETTADSAFVKMNTDANTPEYGYKKKSDLKGIDIGDKLFNAQAGEVFGPFQYGGTFKIYKVCEVKDDTSGVTMTVRHILVGFDNYYKKVMPKTSADSTKAKNMARAKADSILAVLRSKKATFEELVLKHSDDPGSKNTGGKYEDFPKGQMVKPFENFALKKPIGTIDKVETTYGWHIIEVLGRNTKQIKLGVIEKNIQVSDATNNMIFQEASTFAQKAAENRGKNFDKACEELKGNAKRKSNPFKVMDKGISAIPNSREIVRWAFLNAKLGEVRLEPFALEDRFIVAKLTKILEKGVKPFEEVEDQIKTEVIKKKKFEIFKQKIKGNTLEEIAKNYGNGVIVNTANDVTFISNYVPNVGQEPEMLGAIFGMANKGQIQKLSPLIQGNNAVYIFTIESVNNGEPPVESAIKNGQLSLSTALRFKGDAGQILEALKKKFEIQDTRYYYF